ncbi:tripartite tricarboxylate transporter TctB family protein [Martelella sp. AD-3]|uniref:tripartite tricarboxylate transporter TctB family protein n=1 Tax=Martelella sp. AD-3 TaxID=686597 RepID=UPI001377E9D1|nr:tripartite tricarboxylate transporter TctB family protein [Martelella sp. AD-3]
MLSGDRFRFSGRCASRKGRCSMYFERLIGGASIVFGGFLLFFLIPLQVTSQPGPIDPSLFPKIAAWLFILLGLVQLFARAQPVNFGWYEFARLAALAALVLAAAFVMPLAGFLPSAIALMAAVCAFMFERRYAWLAVTIVLVPAATWFVFVIVMGRPLPSIPF